MNDKRIEKLPRWARDYIEKTERERKTAVDALNKYLDDQAPSPFYVEDLLLVGEGTGPSFKKLYIPTRKMTVEHCNVELNILLRDGKIDMSWRTDDEINHRIVAFVPISFQHATLISIDEAKKF